MSKTLCRIGFLFALAFLADQARAAVAEQEVQEVHAVPADVSVSFRNGDGRILVYGSEENEIRITALKRAFTKERLDQIKVDAKLENGKATIDTIFPPTPEGRLEDRSGTVDYTIVVPQGCTLADLELANGELLVQGMRGPSINARLGTGRLLLRDSFSATNLRVGRGGLEIFYGWWEEPFALTAEIAEGNLRVGLPSSAALRLSATSPKGDIRNGFQETETDGLRTLQTAIGDEPYAEFKLQAGDGTIRIEKGD